MRGGCGWFAGGIRRAAVLSAGLVGMAPAFLGMPSARAAEPWRVALPGWEYEFPRDHASHAGFQTEWWYFTGNLRAANGREFGYQLTFFRQGVRPPGETRSESRFVIDDIKFAHFAITEVTDGRFHSFQQLSRGAYGEAGFSPGARVAWIGGWSCERTGLHDFRLRAGEGDLALDLELKSLKQPVIHGRDGVSPKAPGAGRASHYYSLTRLATRGTITTGGAASGVEGLTWFDHEWATNQLAPDQKGWDWFSLHFSDGTELMIFQIRTDAGGRSPTSSGTFVFEDGAARKIDSGEFRLEPARWWRSPETGGSYPVAWRLECPSLDLRLEIEARLDAQELAAKPFAYWEGSVAANGFRAGKPVQATGYLEMTGYAGRIVGLQAAEPPAVDEPPSRGR